MSGAYDGGPAFPVPGLQEDAQFSGISLRAYFAAHAPDVPGEFGRLNVPCVRELAGGRKEAGIRLESTLEWTVRWRLAYADAMLKALQ